MEERNIRCVLEYDGTRFAGWQRQPDERTVQAEVEAAFEHITGRPVRVTAAGRTDAGVHAAGQVINAPVATDMPEARLVRALNGVLPRDVTVLEVSDADPCFNARFDALGRTYRYTISRRRLSIGRRYAWACPFELEVRRLAAATAPLAGECNLRGFSKGPDNAGYNTVIHRCGWREDGHLLVFEIEAVRFFHHAVRSIVGTAVDAARGKRDPEIVARILAERDHSLAGTTAPACGLCLVSVRY